MGKRPFGWHHIQGFRWIIQALRTAGGQRIGLRSKINANTTAVINGQIAGAHYGAEAIPVEWRDLLTMATEITSMADKLYSNAQESITAKLNEEDAS